MKFLDTNLTTEQFVDALEKFEAELPKLFQEWDTIPSELQNEYLDQMSWVLNQAATFIRQKSK